MSDVAEGLPPGGFAPMAPELLVTDLARSRTFWLDVLGFRIAYTRLEGQFMYLYNDVGAQVMLCQGPSNWEVGELAYPHGRGVMLQVEVPALDPVVARLEAAGHTLHVPVETVWRTAGAVQTGQRECHVLDPDGYLVLLSEQVAS